MTITKMYNYYRMVKLATPDGDVITEDALETILRNENFQIPVILKPNIQPLPPKPTIAQAIIPEGQDAWKLWWIQAKPIDDANKAENARFQREVDSLATLLATHFILARLCVTGKKPNGTNILEYVIVSATDTKYTFAQAALRMAGALRPADPIEFICHGRLG